MAPVFWCRETSQTRTKWPHGARGLAPCLGCWHSCILILGESLHLLGPLFKWRDESLLAWSSRIYEGCCVREHFQLCLRWKSSLWWGLWALGRIFIFLCVCSPAEWVPNACCFTIKKESETPSSTEALLIPWFSESGSRAGIFYLKVSTHSSDVLRGDRLFTFHNLLGLLPNALQGSKWQSVTQWTFYSGGTYVWCLAVYPGSRLPENNKTWLTTA